MKKELPPAAIAAIVAVLLIGLVAAFMASTGGFGGQQVVKPSTLSKEELADADPPRPGQPGYVKPTR